MAYGDFKDLAKRTVADKVWRDKAFNIAKNPKHDGNRRGLACMVYKFFDKKTSGGAIKSMSNQQLANELHKPIIKKYVKKEECICHLKTIYLDCWSGRYAFNKQV